MNLRPRELGRQCLEKAHQLIESIWDVLEDSYYGKFKLRAPGRTPVGQLLRVTTALTIAFTASIVSSAVALPFILPTLLFWCLVAPLRCVFTRRVQSFFENLAAGSLIPFVCLWCACVAAYRVTIILGRTTAKSSVRGVARMIRKARFCFDKKGTKDETTILPLTEPSKTALDVRQKEINQRSEDLLGEILMPLETALIATTKHLDAPSVPNAPPRAPPPRSIVQSPPKRKRPSKHAFPFLSLPPELRNRIYTLVLSPYQSLNCTPTPLLRANKPFRSAMSLLRTCRQIRHEAGSHFFSSTTFHLHSRYPFYRNITPHLLHAHLSSLHIITLTNSRGHSNLPRILTHDLPLMPRLTTLALTLTHTDFLQHQETIGHTLRTLRRHHTPALAATMISIPCPSSQGAIIRERLRFWLGQARPAFGGGTAWLHVQSRPSWRGKRCKPHECLGELAVGFPEAVRHGGRGGGMLEWPRPVLLGGELDRVWRTERS